MIPAYKVHLVQEGTIPYETNAIASPADIAAVFRQYVGPVDREYCVVMFLNTKHCLNGINTVSIGSLNASVVHPREVFTPAILAKAHTIVLAHNHPSGNTMPSHEDKEITKRIHAAGKLLDINLLDHVIVGNGYFSFKDAGLL